MMQKLLELPGKVLSTQRASCPMRLAVLRMPELTMLAYTL